jgi:hypothetical protein
MTTETTSAKTQHRWPVLIWMILTQLGFLGTMCMWWFMAGLGLAVFSRDASIGDIMTEIAILLYPVVAIALIVFAWRAYRRGQDVVAAVLTAIPMIIAVVGYNLVTTTVIVQ